MAFTKKTWSFPGSNEISYTYKGRYGAKGEKREKKKKVTPEQIRKQNQWNREKRMRRLMKANFIPGDLWCTLKYPRGTRKSVGEVTKDFRNFRDRLKRQYKKFGEELKFIYRMEIGARGGIHIHLLVNWIRGNPEADSNGKASNGKPPDTALIIQEAWKPCGRIHYEPVYSEGLFQDLACYMTKQPDEEIEKQLSFLPVEDRKKLIKIGSSRNLIRPEPEVKEYSHWTMRKILEEGPEPTPGFYIDQDSVECGVNPVTGMSYLQYIEYELYTGQEPWQQDTGVDIRGDTGKGQNGRKQRKDGMRRAVGGGGDGNG